MRARHPLIHGILYAGLLVCASSSAQFSAQHNLKGFDDYYGTYAPRGDCNREPRITLDDSGFTFRYGGHVTHPATVATAAGMFGRQDTLLAFFPFPTGVTHGESGLEAADAGPLLLALNTQAFTLDLSASNPKAPLTPLQQALIKHSPYAKCGTHTHATSANATPAPAYPVKLNFGASAPEPDAAQAAAIARAAATDFRDFNHPQHPAYALALADLNDDGRTDLLVQYGDGAFCGSAGCSGVIVMATARGYANHAVRLPNFYGRIDVLADRHHGMHDVRFGDGPAWQWNGTQYDANRSTGGSDSTAGPTPADDAAAGSQAPPWKTAQAAGHPLMAYATPIDSTIKRLFVSCRQGQPLLTMLTTAPRPAGPVTLTFVFRGWSLNQPMQRNIYNTNLWMADLSHSDLPLWLAHRGNTATTRKLARAADMAFLRINGRMEGEISLKDSTVSTRTALRTCYRY